MTDVKISQLPTVTTIDAGTDVLPLVSLDGGSTLTTYQATAQQTVNAALAAPGPIGSGTANTGAFTTLSASSTVSGTGFSTYLASPPAIGGTAPAAGAFTNVSASGTVSGAGFSSYLASPPAIGGTAAAAGSFTTLAASNDVTVTGGDVVIATAGKGIDFSAVTPAPGMTSQVLTDYERGTWTPSIGGDATYLLQEGYYVKVGNLVFVQGKIQINTIGTGSTTDIQGLPFVSFASILASGGTGGVAYFSNLLSSVTSITPLIAASSTSLYFGSLASAASTSTGVTPVFQDNTRIDFSLTYISAN